MGSKRDLPDKIIFVFMLLLAILYLTPILIVLMNSVKGRFFIADTPFALPTAETFVGLKNYTSGLEKTGFIQAFGYSLFITVFSVGAIVLFTSMTAWAIIRVKSKFSTFMYYLLVFSMIVPFQMVMFTMSKMANMTHLDNPVGIIVLYLGFGAGLSVFVFSGFIKGIPHEIEEAALIDDQIADDGEMVERFDPHPARIIVAQKGVAGELRHAVDHLAATAADRHPARPAEGQAAVEMILDVLQALEHRHIISEGHLIALKTRFGIGCGIVAKAFDLDGAGGGVGHGRWLRTWHQVNSARWPAPP
jgi:hypothetical protein